MIFSTPRILLLQRMAGVACGFLMASVLAAQVPGQPDYFPLQVGNTWLYKAITTFSTQPLRLNTTYQTVRVTGTETVGNQQYFDVSYFGRDLLLREDTTGNVIVYNRAD